MVTDVLIFFRVFVTQHNLGELDRKGSLFIVQERPQLDLRAALLFNDSADVELFCKLVSCTLLESQLLTVSATFKAYAKNVGEGIRGPDFLSLVEFSDHLFFNLAS
jgi:hypothetical protein